jgi:FemAB-related protein (PEP-CTERM system-associated)
METRLLEDSDRLNWDNFVRNHPSANLYQLSDWIDVLSKAYSHKGYYLIAQDDSCQNGSKNSIAGILPLVHMKHFLFGNSLISMPFFDMGGAIAVSAEAERALLGAAYDIGASLGADNIEIRSTRFMTTSFESSPAHGKQNRTGSRDRPGSLTKSHKVRMLLELPASSGDLMNSFKSKLRSQIRLPIKEGLTSKVGGVELLEDFYRVFLVNMRDLGSPVHSKGLIKAVMEIFAEKARLAVVYHGGQPLAGGLVIGFGDTIENPWASSLRKYAKLSPNMLLYWTMLEFACDNGYRWFDFGRSTPDEGTYRFKQQWGAVPKPLFWQYIGVNKAVSDSGADEKSRFDKAVRYWQKLPLAATRILGPVIRRHIGL